MNYCSNSWTESEFLTFHCFLRPPPQDHLLFPFPSAGINHSPIKPCSFKWIMVFRNEDLGSRCAYCSRGVIASEPSQHTARTDACIKTHSCMHLYFYLSLSFMYACIHTTLYVRTPTWTHIYKYEYIPIPSNSNPMHESSLFVAYFYLLSLSTVYFLS